MRTMRKLLRRICCFLRNLLRHCMSQYPRPGYHFTVECGGARISVSEVTGLDIELAVIEHRDGSDPTGTARKLPGVRKFANVVLKRGLVVDSNEFFEWFNAVQMNNPERRDLVINLLDEQHQPVVSWRIRNAFPCKYSGPHLKADGNEVAIETLELAHEGLAIES
jgi:phage tail-like protein